MKKKDAYILVIHKYLFGIMLLSVVVFLIFGEIFMPAENPTDSGECRLYEGEWERVYPNGNREEIKIPTVCEADRGEVVRLETVLSSEQQDEWFAIRASQQDMRVYVDGELRQEYSTKGSRIFGGSSASAFVFFRVFSEDAGKLLAIEQVSGTEYTGFINEAYVGEKYDIAKFFIRECLGVLFVSVCMFIISFIAVVTGAVLRFVYKRRVDVTYLGLGVLQLSLAMISESRVRQFFLPNGSIASHAGFFLTMLVPYPFIVYVCRLQNDRYIKLYKGLSLVVALNFLISSVLQITGIADLGDTSVVAYGLIGVMLVLFIITIGLDIKNGRLGEYGEVVIGLIVMMAATLWEFYVTFVPNTPYYGGVALSYGLLVLLFMANVMRSLLKLEQTLMLRN